MQNSPRKQQQNYQSSTAQIQQNTQLPYNEFNNYDAMSRYNSMIVPMKQNKVSKKMQVEMVRRVGLKHYL